MASKPTYIPKRKRQRFHGAFTGGFSAGYFNTVGSKEGYQETKKQLSLEDIMDEQDHNEWGGPTRVARSFVRHDASSQRPLVVAPPTTVGQRLLRALGYRDSTGLAYLPTSSTLSKNRLRRIQLQQARVKIPYPKLDATGLGYQAFSHAPEFQAAHDKRKQGDYYNDAKAFVGNKSVSGFALQEDEDDTYDNQGDHRHKTVVDKEQYDTVVYEPGNSSSDDEQQHTNLGAALTSWAQPVPERSVGATTADGKLPLAGFVIGGSGTDAQRFRGPDLPPGYEIQPHQFGPNEHPLVFQALSRAVQLETADQRRHAAMQDALQSNVVQKPPARLFAGVSASMMERFAPSKGIIPAPEPAKPTPIHVNRSVAPFAPVPLLCKRLHVPALQLPHLVTQPSRTREESFFDEVMAKLPPATTPTGTNATLQLPETVDQYRPSIEVYKSIFDSVSSDEASASRDANVVSEQRIRSSSPQRSTSSASTSARKRKRRKNERKRKRAKMIDKLKSKGR